MTIKSIIINYKNQKDNKIRKKQYELRKRRLLVIKQNESNKELNQHERRWKREKLVEENFILCRFSELATTIKFYVNGLNLHQIKKAEIGDHTCDFEIVGSMLIGEMYRRTNIRFRHFDDFETFINAIDVNYDSAVVIFTRWLYNLNTPEIKKMNRSHYATGTDLKQDIVNKVSVVIFLQLIFIL